MNTPLRPAQLDHRVTGYHTTASTLRDVIQGRTTLLVFLRHYG
jgi:hypothetical protein